MEQLQPSVVKDRMPGYYNRENTDHLKAFCLQHQKMAAERKASAVANTTQSATVETTILTGTATATPTTAYNRKRQLHEWKLPTATATTMPTTTTKARKEA